MKTKSRINPPVYNPPTYPEVVKRVQKQLDTKITTTKKQLSDGKIWLEDARSTLKSSKLIMENNPFDALYTWCHAIEKMAKAYALIMGVVTEEELKPLIGHLTPNIGIKLINRVENQIPLADYMNQTYSDSFQLYADVIKQKGGKSRIRPYQKFMLDMSFEDFEALLKFCEMTDEELKSGVNADKLYDTFRDNPNHVNIISDMYSIIKRFPREQIIELINTILDQVKLSPILFHPTLQILCLISSSYLDIAKYPIEHKDLINKDSYILKTLDKLYTIGEDTANKLEMLSTVMTTTD